MDTKQLKKYAPEARRDFIEAVANKAAVYGLLPDETLPMKEEGDVVIIGDRPFARSVAKQRKELEDRIRKEGFQQFIEAIAYTWFNRFVAIRYMELHGYLDHGYRVLSHPDGKLTPEILANAERIQLPGLNQDEVVDLKLDGGKDEQLYQMLLLAQCNALHKAMPFLFESIKDGTELLLPDNLLHTDSLMRTLVNDIPEEQWENVEIIGWLYQAYISEKKEEVIGKVVRSEDIPAATQLFTPNWIVRYMLHNTLGRKWLATYPDSPLRQQMEFYIEPAEQTPDVQQQLTEITPDSLNPEELTLLDPACGSGHILVEAYDLFRAIYLERGYRVRDIPKLILTRNLFGLEIDKRAEQLAAFTLMMKARGDDRTIFELGVQPQVIAIQESGGLDASELADAINAPLESDGTTADISSTDIAQMLQLFADATTLGTLIQIPERLEPQLQKVGQRLTEIRAGGGMLEKAAALPMQPITKQAQVLAASYSIIVANPPFIGRRYMNATLKHFGQSFYSGADSDVFSMMIERSYRFAEDTSMLGFVSPFVWMFISTFSDFRETLETDCTLCSLVQLEYNAFEPACVPVCAFTFQNTPLLRYRGDFIQLSRFKGHENQAPRTIEAIKNPDCGWRFRASSEEFGMIPGRPVAYWASAALRNAFANGTPLSDLAEPRQGMATADNDRFLRRWHEVSISTVGLRLPDRETAKDSQNKWFPYNKGGGFRKWYGNNEFVVNWENDGQELNAFKPKAVIRNPDYYFRPSITWSFISSSFFAVRQSDSGFLFDVGGSSAFPPQKQMDVLTGFLCSKVAFDCMTLLNPTLNFQVGNVASLPILEGPIESIRDEVVQLVVSAVEIARNDWDASETSWDFQRLPMLTATDCPTVELSTNHWSAEVQSRRTAMKTLEERNNSLFLAVYGVEGECTPEVLDEHITLRSSDEGEDIQRLISFAVGCMMGRYSLDVPGLIYADSGNEGFDTSKYIKFPADEDGIVPITETAWFPDDAENRFEQFIKTAWPRERVEENLTFIAENLSRKKSETSQDCIRRYLATGFFKHHLSLYRKRPIYWMFSSGKQRAFQCLVYLHRYNAGTLSRMRTEYVVRLQGKVNSRIEQLESDVSAANSTSHRKKLEKERDKLIKQREELQTFDEKLRHYADQRIELDLDDGVKVNYGKFGDLLAEVKVITGKKPEVIA